MFDGRDAGTHGALDTLSTMCMCGYPSSPNPRFVHNGIEFGLRVERGVD